MKKLSLFLAVLLLTALLTGCAIQQDGNALYQDMPTAPQNNQHLTVFCIDRTQGSEMIRAAMKLYQQRYPDVEVELVEPLELNGSYKSSVPIQETYEQLSAQIMAGEGPDVLLVDDDYMDVEKLVRQGVFADMDPFFLADHFDWEPYNQGVMDAGVWNGKRFVIPLAYDFPLLFTTKAALEETGFDVDACKDYQRFLDETTRFLESPDQTRRLFYDAWSTDYITFGMLDYSGVSIADYDNRTIDLSLPVFRSTAQWYKSVLKGHSQELNVSRLGGASTVRDGQALWTNSIFGAYHNFYATAGALRTVGEVVMMPIRDVDGGIRAQIKDAVAVRAGSENLQNAYDFLKLLLSPEVQYTASELSIFHDANERLLARGINWYIPEGTEGFSSTERNGSALNAPSQEEIRQFLDFIKEITGGYYYNNLHLYARMHPYLAENADFEETLKEAQRQLEIYISE